MNKVYRLLLVEDEVEIGKIVIKYAEKNGYQCHWAKNGLEALEAFANQPYHLVLLDVGLPGIDGFEVLGRIRASSDVPIIMVTAKQEEVDRLKGFRDGADDYVIKPFSPRELMERIKVFLKRTYHAKEEVILQLDGLRLYTASMKVTLKDLDVGLTGAEFKILQVLMTHQGHVLTRDQLLNLAFGELYDGVDRNIDSYIKRIRQKIEEDPKQPKYLRTKYGLGYVFGGDRS